MLPEGVEDKTLPASSIERTATALRAAAMAYPEAYEDFPWGEVAVKVKKKVFLFLFRDAEKLSLSCKLPRSSDMALMLPFARPTGYGLGKSGWVSASFTAKEVPPVDLLRDWIDESYRAVAPKRLVELLAAVGKATPLGDEGGRKKVTKKVTKTKVGAKTAVKVGARAGVKKDAKVSAGGRKAALIRG